MQNAVMVVGFVAEVIGWWNVSSRGRDVWRLMPWVLGAMGVAAVLVRHPVWVSKVSTGVAVGVGLATGAALYVGTLVFVWLAAKWRPFRADVEEEYREAATISVALSLVLSLVIMVPAEELFWRGLVQQGLGASASIAVGVLVAWVGYILANLPSKSLPIAAGAVVGGAVWGALAWWSGGVLAALASHILWTGAMLAHPPRVGRSERGAGERAA